MNSRDKLVASRLLEEMEKRGQAKWRTLPNLLRLTGKSRGSRGDLLLEAKRRLTLRNPDDLPGFGKLMQTQNWVPSSQHDLTKNLLSANTLPTGVDANNLSRKLVSLVRGHTKFEDTPSVFKGLSRRSGPMRGLGLGRIPLEDIQGVHASPVIDSASNYMKLPAGDKWYGMLSTYKPSPKQLYGGDWSLEGGGVLNSIPRVKSKLSKVPTSEKGMDLFGRVKDFFYETAVDPGRRTGTVLARTGMQDVTGAGHNAFEVSDITPRAVKALESLAQRVTRTV